MFFDEFLEPVKVSWTLVRDQQMDLRMVVWTFQDGVDELVEWHDSTASAHKVY